MELEPGDYLPLHSNDLKIHGRREGERRGRGSRPRPGQQWGGQGGGMCHGAGNGGRRVGQAAGLRPGASPRRRSPGMPRKRSASQRRSSPPSSAPPAAARPWVFEHGGARVASTGGEVGEGRGETLPPPALPRNEWAPAKADSCERPRPSLLSPQASQNRQEERREVPRSWLPRSCGRALCKPGLRRCRRRQSFRKGESAEQGERRSHPQRVPQAASPYAGESPPPAPLAGAREMKRSGLVTASVSLSPPCRGKDRADALGVVL